MDPVSSATLALVSSAGIAEYSALAAASSVSLAESSSRVLTSTLTSVPAAWIRAIDWSTRVSPAAWAANPSTSPFLATHLLSISLAFSVAEASFACASSSCCWSNATFSCFSCFRRSQMASRLEISPLILPMSLSAMSNAVIALESRRFVSFFQGSMLTMMMDSSSSRCFLGSISRNGTVSWVFMAISFLKRTSLKPRTPSSKSVCE